MFRVNCEQLTSVGDKFIADAEKVDGIIGALRALENEFAESWKGGDSYNFLISFNKHNSELSYLKAFLKNNGEFLKEYSDNHDQLDQDYGNAMSG